ncbi:ALG-2 interacting protein X-like protein [Carex littledalei]|uniref:ALG-2 interacting protein X-like protein n=1 Tax=Carex littledalei TaxID=544730 RepID=A0A833QLJ0_9POAL|nr:ALG-2 interacting protein X-like protein [Carex littledalei]
MAWIPSGCRQIDISPVNYKAMDDLSFPMLTIQEKIPPPTSNVGWTTIADQELSDLQRSRSRLTQTAFSAPATVCFESRLHQWYSYFHSLSKIKPHYTMALERSHLKALYFTWHDSFKPWKKHSHTSIDSEKVAVVFNVGAVYSQMAATENQGTVDGLTKAFKAFQSAAAAFRYLKEIFGEGESVDVSRECVSMLETLMVAQAQECFFNRVVRAGKSPTNCSKAARQVELYYEEVLDALSTAPLNGYCNKMWFAHVQLKASQFYAEACYHYSLYLHNNEEIGEEIARLQTGTDKLRSTKRAVKGASSSLINVITKLEKNMNSRLEKVRNENYSIYNMRVPAAGSLSDLPTHVSKRPTPLKCLAALDHVMIQTVSYSCSLI